MQGIGAAKGRRSRVRAAEQVQPWKDPYTMKCGIHVSLRFQGVCPRCLTERLEKLFCPDCGEQKIYSEDSCSCSDATFSSSSPRANAVGDADLSANLISRNLRKSGHVNIGSVGRISMLIENDIPAKTDGKAVHVIRRSKSEAASRSFVSVEFENPSSGAKSGKKSSGGLFGFLRRKKSKGGDLKDKDKGKESARKSDFIAPVTVSKAEKNAARKSFSTVRLTSQDFKATAGGISGRGSVQQRKDAKPLDPELSEGHRSHGWRKAFTAPVKALIRSGSRR